MTAFGLHPRSYPVPSVDHRPRADVIPIGGRTTTTGPVLVSLAQAATALPVSTKVLWVEYLTLGGSLDLDWFCAHLDSPAAPSPRSTRSSWRPSPSSSRPRACRCGWPEHDSGRPPRGGWPAVAGAGSADQRSIAS
ncbi:hypothetical protein ACFQX8_12835 [Klenkia terrae]|uniref:hypothetical protein n=1 Tax=Klenkia terrae TaxID=1052259 RepID=UPI003608E041